MIIKYLDYIGTMTKHIDAIIIVNRKGIVEYSGMYNHTNKRFMDEGVIGKHILEIYPELTEETSSHYRVKKTRTPILNEKQYLTNYYGDKEKLINSTFPIFDKGEVIGTIEISVFDEQSDHIDQTEDHYTLDDIITNAPSMHVVKDRITRIANSDASVLIVGETGTGKELVAQSIHTHSKRHNKAFISLNCAAIPSTLLESVLFGTTSGTFTGAEKKAGLFQEADGGTLFLDEVNSMEYTLQAKILKVIEEKKFRPLGGAKEIKANVRIVSAMNISPSEALKNRLIRQDLYYRLATISIGLPPLRERKEDILLLANHFLKGHTGIDQETPFQISEIAQRMFLDYNWPGNVRELKNIIEGAIHLCQNFLITVHDLPEHLLYNYEHPSLLEKQASPDNEPPLDEQVKAYERQLIQSAISKSSSMADAARILGISRQSLRYKIEKHSL
jgi:arginine utilization regulatory protein